MNVIKRFAGVESSPNLPVDFSARSRHVERWIAEDGSCLTQSGLSHWCDRPTSISSAPRAHTISVALANSETIRTLCSFSCRLVQALNDSVAAEYHKGVKGVAQDLIPVEWYTRQETGRQSTGRVRIHIAGSPDHEIGDKEEEECQPLPCPLAAIT